MAKTVKKKKKKLKKPKAKRKAKADPNIEETYWDTITFFCPVKNKMITQKIQVKKYKSLGDILRLNKTPVLTPDPLSGIEQEDDLNIYGTTEETDE